MARRDEIAAYITTYVEVHHNSPSSYQIARRFKISRQMVDRHIDKLIKEGKAIRVDGDLKLVHPPNPN